MPHQIDREKYSVNPETDRDRVSKCNGYNINYFR